MSDRSIAAGFVYARVEHVLGEDATREDVAWLLSKAKFRAGVSDEIRDLVLEMFEPERVPVPGLDYQPEEDHFFITVEGSAEVEVSKQVYVQTERGCGFHNTLGQPDEPATSSFGAGPIRGRIAYGRRMGLSEHAVAVTP